MRNIAFSQTTEAFLAGIKDVTRRTGWLHLRPGTWLMAVERSQGLRKGEKIRRLGPIEVLSVRRERLDAITDEDVAREGFPGRSRHWFIERYCATNLYLPSARCTRIEFHRHIAPCRWGQAKQGDAPCCSWLRCPYLLDDTLREHDCPLMFNLGKEGP